MTLVNIVWPWILTINRLIIYKHEATVINHSQLWHNLLTKKTGAAHCVECHLVVILHLLLNYTLQTFSLRGKTPYIPKHACISISILWGYSLLISNDLYWCTNLSLKVLSSSVSRKWNNVKDWLVQLPGLLIVPLKL